MPNATITTDQLSIKFWGVRGSLPAPLAPATLERKIEQVLRAALASGVSEDNVAEWLASQPRHAVSTYGGNTSCVEVHAGGKIVVIDMGSGMRELGNALIPSTFANSGLEATILVSHVHWDHIQGLPFFAPLYLPRGQVPVHLDLWGGTNWHKPLKHMLTEQMSAPAFPVEFKKIEKEGANMRFHTIHDRLAFTIPTAAGDLKILCRRLNHPQETYGFRLEFNSKTFAYCTDNGVYQIPDPPLVDLVANADIAVLDCQFDEDEFLGKKGGPPKLDWGHAEPKYVGAVGRAARPKKIITFHHDPYANDCHITAIARAVQALANIPTEAAYEGLTIAL